MFQVEDNLKIGRYLDGLININFRSRRQFCRAYLEATNSPVNDEELRKMNNRFTQIVKGKKGLQLYDLPVITELFGISCEELLSCGKVFVPSSSHMTNYDIAFSKNPKEWKKYMASEDSLFLNADEYGKTVVDYALEFKNYAFIDWLMDKEYISFDEQEWYGVALFLAKTKMKPRNVMMRDADFPPNIMEAENLRTRLVGLAIENADLKIMKKMKGREMPTLYQQIYGNQVSEERYLSDEVMINSIANSNLEEVFNYFSEEFEVPLMSKCIGTYVYPGLGKVIDAMLNNGTQNEDILRMMLRRTAEHNKKALDSISKKAEAYYHNLIGNLRFELPDDMKQYYRQDTMYGYSFEKSTTRVSFLDMSPDGIRTNAICITENSEMPSIQNLIDEINTYYEKLENFKEYFMDGSV